MSDAEVTYRNDAADAALMLSRIGMAALAIGVPAAAGLAGNAISILFGLGLGLLFAAEALDPATGARRRLQGLRFSWLALATLAFAGWAFLSLGWSPFPAAGARRFGIVLLIGAPTFLAIVGAKPHVRAADLYLFPLGVVAAMAATAVLGVASRQGATIADGAAADLAAAVVSLLFPSMAALSARGRNGLARGLVILALIYVWVVGAPAATAALLAGFAAFSFALSDPRRTARDLGILAAAAALLAPIAPLVAPWFIRVIGSADPAAIAQPGPALVAAAGPIRGDPLRLLTGHGLEATVRALKGGVLPATAPRSLIFEIWYDLGIVGAAIFALGLMRAFVAVTGAAPRVQPYLMATLASLATFAFTNSGWGDERWLVLAATAAIAADCGVRGQYGTRAPSASALAQF